MIDDIITDVLKAEGWDKYTNRPNDRGGPTKWGITQKAWADWRGRDVTIDEIKNISEPQARDFYEAEYVIGPRFNALPIRLQALLIDCGVNHGPNRATKWLQRAVAAKEDGSIGPKTLIATEAANPVGTYIRVCAYRSSFYGKLVTDDPTQAEFAHGWANRNSKWLTGLADTL